MQTLKHCIADHWLLLCAGIGMVEAGAFFCAVFGANGLLSGIVIGLIFGSAAGVLCGHPSRRMLVGGLLGVLIGLVSLQASPTLWIVGGAANAFFAGMLVGRWTAWQVSCFFLAQLTWAFVPGLHPWVTSIAEMGLIGALIGAFFQQQTLWSRARRNVAESAEEGSTCSTRQ
jgi:hypothetical protein